MKRHTCGLKSNIFQHPLKLVASIDAAFKAQPKEASGVAPRWLPATLCEDRGEGKELHGDNKKASPIDFTLLGDRGV